MACHLRYGTSSSVPLKLREGALVATCGMPPLSAVEDPAAAAGQTLAEPLAYPPLREATTPGDRVVLALAEGVPAADQVIAAAVGALSMRASTRTESPSCGQEARRRPAWETPAPGLPRK